MAAMTDRPQKLTNSASKLQNLLVEFDFAVSAVGGHDKIPGLALEEVDFARTSHKTMTFNVCVWTALVLYRSTETWSSTASGQKCSVISEPSLRPLTMTPVCWLSSDS